MAKNEISYKADLPAHQAVSHLENLVESLKRGSVCLQVGGEYVALALDKAALPELSMGASEKKGKYRLTWELSWKEAAPAAAGPPDLQITNRPPAEPPAPTPAATPPKQSAASPKAEPQKKPPAKAKEPGGAKSRSTAAKSASRPKTQTARSK